MFVPADDSKKINKASKLAADCITLECEDGVAINKKVSIYRLSQRYSGSLQRSGIFDFLLKWKSCVLSWRPYLLAYMTACARDVCSTEKVGGLGAEFPGRIFETTPSFETTIF